MDAREHLEVERRRLGLVKDRVVEAPAELDDSAAQEALRARSLRVAEPYVREIRTDLFGLDGAPWQPEQLEEARAWIRGRFDAELRPPGPAEREEIDLHVRRLRELDRSRVTLQRPVLMFAGEPFPLDIDSSLRPLAEAARRIAMTTGFSESAVTAWVLLGVEPGLPRVRIKVRDSVADLAGTKAGRRSVVLELNTPLNETDLRRLFRQVREAFVQRTMPFRIRELQGRQGPSITPLDRHLANLVAQTPGATWEQRAEVWQRRPIKGKSLEEWMRTKGKDGNIAAPALRIRFDRYKKKLERLPSPENVTR
jgi:hypothetical protein